MLALKLLARNWQSGELKLLTIALVIAVTVVSCISIFVARLEASLQLQTAELLGADSAVISPSIHPESWILEANKRGIRHTNFIRMQTMAYVDDFNSLVSLHVVNQGYPLRGNLYITDAKLNSTGEKLEGKLTRNIPKPGNVWVSEDLLLSLDITIGQIIEIGNSTFTISHILTNFPEPFSRYPVVMMNQKDLEMTGIIMPGSQLRYRWLLASDNTDALNNFKLWLEEQLNPNQEISDAHSRSNWLERTVKRSTSLLSLSAVISVLLAGVAISIATRQFVERHVAQVAIKKSFGASSQQIKYLYFGQLLYLGITASVLGVLLGHLLQEGITYYIQQFLTFEIASTSYLSYVYSGLSGIGFLLFFALPPLWHLPSIPPIRVLRSDLPSNSTKQWVRVLFACIVIFGLIALFSRDIVLTLKVSGVLVIVVVLTLLLAKLTLWLCNAWATRVTGFWRLGLVNMQRRYEHNTLLIAVFSTTIMALLSLTLIRNDFWEEIQQYAVEEEINVFLLNISEQEKPLVENFLTGLNLNYEKIYPTIIGRVAKVNANAPTDEQADYWVFKRDVWMTWFNDLPENQPLLEGKWWPELEPSEDGLVYVSVREDVMENAELILGDILTFSIGGELQEAKITSVRPDLKAMSLTVAFAFQPKDMQHYYHIYNIGLNVPKQHKNALYQFGREYPTITIDSFDTWLEKTQKILKQVLDGALLVLLLILLSGCVVMFATVNSSIASRQQETGLLRAFGSSQKMILGSIWVEFSTIGLISGIIAVVSSEILFHQMQTMMSDLPMVFHYEYWMPVIFGTTVIVGILGVVACKGTVSTPPNEVLRKAT